MAEYKLVYVFNLFTLSEGKIENRTRRTDLRNIDKFYNFMVFSTKSREDLTDFLKRYPSKYFNEIFQKSDNMEFNKYNIQILHKHFSNFFSRFDKDCLVIFSDETPNQQIISQYSSNKAEFEDMFKKLNIQYQKSLALIDNREISLADAFNNAFPSALTFNKDTNFYQLELNINSSAYWFIFLEKITSFIRENEKKELEEIFNFLSKEEWALLYNQTLIPNPLLQSPLLYYRKKGQRTSNNNVELLALDKEYSTVYNYYGELRTRVWDKYATPRNPYFEIKNQPEDIYLVPGNDFIWFDNSFDHTSVDYKIVSFYNVSESSKKELSLKTPNQGEPSNTNIVNLEKTLDSGLYYLTSNDLKLLSNLPNYINENKYFEWTHKEYISNVFYKTLVLEIDNEFEETSNEKQSLTEKGVVTTKYDIGANAFVSTAAGINNIVAQIPILSQEYPTNQFLSSSEPTYQFNFVSKNLAQETVGLPLIPKAIETLRALTNKYGREYKFIPDAPFILIDSFVTRLFGSFKEEYINHILLGEGNYKVDIKKPIAIESTEHRTLESSPGATAYTLRFSESNTYEPELLKEALTNKVNTEANEDFMKKALDLILSNCDLANVSKDYAFKKNAFESNPGDYLSFTSKYFTADDFLRGVRLKKPELIQKLTELDLIKIVDHNLKIMAKHLDNLWDYLLSFEDIKKNESSPLLIKSFSGIKIKSGLDFSDSETRDTFSQHYFGSAVDIIVPGYNIFFIAELIRKYMYKQLKGYGLGLYGNVFIPGELSLKDMGDGAAANSGFIHFDLNLTLTSSSYSDAFAQYCVSIDKTEQEVRAITRKNKSELSSEEKVIVSAVRDLKLNNKITDTKDFESLDYSSNPRFWSADIGGEYAIKDPVTNAGIDIWKYKPDSNQETFYKVVIKNIDVYNLYAGFFLEQNNSPINIDDYLNSKIEEVDIAIQNNDDENQERSEESVRFKTEIVDYKVKLEPESARLDKDFNPNYSGGNILTYNSWKERLEQVLGEKSSDLVGTSISDKRLKDLEDTQKKAFLTNYKNRSLSNETEVSVFTNTVGNIINADPGYFKGITNNKQLKDALDDYFNANGLVVYYDKSALPSDGNTTLNNDLSLSFYIADPSSVGSFSETASSNYNNREIINLIKMACNLKDLASIFLIEPEIYLENKEDVQKEYEMIQKELYGISPIPSFFNNLTFGVCGSLLPTAEDIIQAEAVFSNLETDYDKGQFSNNEENKFNIYIFYNFINKNHPNYNASIIKKFLMPDSELHIILLKQIASFVVLGIAGYVGSLVIAIGGAIFAMLTFFDLATFEMNIEYFNKSLKKTDDRISKPKLNTNLFRLLENLSRGSFMTSLNTTDDVAFGTSVFAGLDRRGLFNRIYVERETKQEAIYSLNQLMIDLEDSDSHQSLANSVIRQFVEQNPVMVDYQELASTISVNNALKSLINFEFLNSNTGEKEKNIFVGKDIFDPFLAKDWIMFLVSFRHTTQFFGQLDDEDFNDCYTYDNDKKAFIRVKDDSLYIPQLDSSNENYLIERNLGSRNTVLDETTLIAKVPRVYRYSDETKRKNYFQRLKEQNKIRIAYLKNLLVQIVESLKQYDFFANNLAGFGSENQIEFDFATENAYPDIDLPLDPANPLSNINISPGFFYVKNYYSEQVLKETKSQAINILQKSYNFMGKLETGVYSGDANDFKNQAQDSITKGVIVDIKDANLTAGTGEFNNQIAVLTNKELTELIPKIKFDSQTSNTDLDYTDISLITIQDILKRENDTDTIYQALEEHMNSVAERASALENSFGSRAGFINETSVETLNFYKDFDNTNNPSDDTNKLLGLSNDSNISLNVLQEIADVSGNKLLENQFDISKAYPTFKFYLIEEDSIDSDNIFVFDDFYSFNAIKDFTVYKSRKLAADTAVIRLQNISGTLDGTKFAVIRDVDYEINDRIIEKEQFGQAPSSEPIQSVVLRPGVCCQLRAGYSSNPKDLTILLSGRIADVAWSNNGDMCEVTVQSFAVELETRKYGASDIDNGLDEKQFHSTHKLLAWCLFRNELKHFGRYKKQRLFQKGESKDVVITKETHIGTGDPSTSASMFEFFMSNWGYFAAAEIALCFVNFGALTSAGKELAKAAAKEVVKEAAESTATTAASEVAETVVKEAVKDTAKVSTSTVLNIFSRNVFKAFGFGKEVIQNTPSWLGLGKLIKFVSGSGLNINASTKLINAELQAIETIIAKDSLLAAENIAASSILQQANQNILTQAAATTRLSNVLAYLGNFIGWQTQTVTRGSTLASRLWSINPTSLNIALEQYVAKGLAGGLEDQTLRIAVRNAILTEMTNATTNLWTAGLRKAFQAVSLGAIRAVKLGVILPLLTYSVGLVWDTISSVLKYFYNLVMGTFNPYSEALVLSPQDDALYAPHPDRYIVGSSNFAAVQSDEAIKRLKRALATAYLFYDPAKTNSPNEDILLNRTLLMDKRLNAKRGENVFKIKNSTIWEIFHEMSLRHPGWVYGARQYGQSLEYRMFFGLPNQRYFGKPLANLEIKRLNSIIEATTKGDEASIINLVSKETAAKLDSLLTNDTRSKRVSIMKTLLLEEWTRITKDRFIPFRNYHLISSKYNLVANNIAGSNNDVINEIAILYLENNSGSMPQYTQRVIRVHDNMTEDQVHAKAVKYDNCKGFNSALRYGTAELVNSAKEMYRGEIIILGNPQINPYDICILEDEYSEMFGPIEVEAVTHIFSMDTGFITEIKPNALVTANEGLTYPVLNSVAMYDIGRELSKQADFNFRKLEDAQKKAIVSSIVDKWLDDNVNFMTLPWEKDPAVELSFTGAIKLATGEINPDFKNVLVQRTLQELEKGNIILQSDILSPNANLGGFLTTDNIAATLASLGVAAGLARNRLGSTPAVLLGLLSLGTSQAPTLLENQLSTPGSFLINKLLTGDMLISQVTDGNLIQVYPLFKNNRPLVYGGYQRIPLNKSIKNKLGNIFFEISEAMTMFNTISKEYSNRENIIYSKPNFVIETAGNIAESLLPFKLPTGTVTGYLGSYTKDEVINAASTGGRL